MAGTTKSTEKNAATSSTETASKAASKAGTTAKTVSRAGTTAKTASRTGTAAKTTSKTGTAAKTASKTGTATKTTSKTGTTAKTTSKTGTTAKTTSKTGTTAKTASKTGTAAKTASKTGTAAKTTSKTGDNAELKLTAREKKLVQLFRKANTDTKNTVLNVLSGEASAMELIAAYLAAKGEKDGSGKTGGIDLSSLLPGGREDAGADAADTGNLLGSLLTGGGNGSASGQEGLNSILNILGKLGK